MCDNILSFNGFNHLIKSWTIYLFVMIQAKRNTHEMIIKPYQGEYMEFHVICAKCGIHKNGTIVTIW